MCGNPALPWCKHRFKMQVIKGAPGYGIMHHIRNIECSHMLVFVIAKTKMFMFDCDIECYKTEYIVKVLYFTLITH